MLMFYKNWGRHKFVQISFENGESLQTKMQLILFDLPADRTRCKIEQNLHCMTLTSKERRIVWQKKAIFWRHTEKNLQWQKIVAVRMQHSWQWISGLCCVLSQLASFGKTCSEKMTEMTLTWKWHWTFHRLWKNVLKIIAISLSSVAIPVS